MRNENGYSIALDINKIDVNRVRITTDYEKCTDQFFDITSSMNPEEALSALRTAYKRASEARDVPAFVAIYDIAMEIKNTYHL